MKNAYLIITLLTVLMLCQITAPLISQSKKEVIEYRKTHLEELLSDPRKPITTEEKDLIKYYTFLNFEIKLKLLVYINNQKNCFMV